MKRLAQQDINTPDHFDDIWRDRDQHRWDLEKTAALAQKVSVDDTIIEIGAGRFGVCEYLAMTRYPSRKIVLDFSPEARRQATELYPEIEWHLEDMTKPITQTHPPADIVIAGEVIEHMEDPALFVATMAHLAKPGDGSSSARSTRPARTPRG